MSNDTPLFSRPVHVSEIPDAGRRFTITTSPEERAAVAHLLGLPAVADLSAKLEVTPFRKDGLAVGGSLHTRLTQTCVVSLEEFETTLDAPIEIRFSTDGVDPNLEFDLAELNDPYAEDPPDLLVGGQINLGSIITEFLALELDPYPRKPGVEFAANDEETSLSPFEALNALKNKGE
jgi:hypothetical protein